MQAVGQRHRYTSEGLSQMYSALFCKKQTCLSFGSVENDQVSIAPIGDCLKGHVHEIDHCLSTRHDKISSGVCICQVPVRNSAVIRIPKRTGYEYIVYMQ